MLFVVVAVAVFFWAVKSEQFDDLDRQSVSILFDEDSTSVPSNTQEKDQENITSSESDLDKPSANKHN